MSEQPEALRLADELYVGDFDYLTNHGAAEELRRLHALCDELGEALEDLIDTGFTRGPQGKRATKALARWKESK